MSRTSASEALARIAKGKSKAPKGAPRRKRSGGNSKPSRNKYWESNALRKHKVHNLMRKCGYTRADAEALWDRTRTTRQKKRAA